MANAQVSDDDSSNSSTALATARGPCERRGGREQVLPDGNFDPDLCRMPQKGRTRGAAWHQVTVRKAVHVIVLFAKPLTVAEVIDKVFKSPTD